MTAAAPAPAPPPAPPVALAPPQAALEPSLESPPEVLVQVAEPEKVVTLPPVGFVESLQTSRSDGSYFLADGSVYMHKSLLKLRSSLTNSSSFGPTFAAIPSVSLESPAQPAVHRTNQYGLFFATSRQRADPTLSKPDKHPEYFSDEWETGPLTYGTCWVTIPTDSELPFGVIEGSVRFFGVIDLPDNMVEDVWMHRPRILASSNEFFTALSQAIPRLPQRSVLIGVHGFNNSFEFAGRRLAKMAHDMDFKGALVLYSWPGGRSGGEYGRAEDRVHQPYEMERFVAFLDETIEAARAGGAQCIGLVAHSMGNRLLQYAALRLGSARAKALDAVVLAAPDIPREGFAATIWPSLQVLSQRTALYVSRFDKALFGSEKIHKTGPRLGQSGPDPLVLAGLETIDASHADDTFLHHDYHLRLAGICDLAALLIDRWSPAQRVEKGFLRQPQVPPRAEWFELVQREGGPCR